MTLVVLFLLTSLDGALCGCRTCMGRHPYIFKKKYFARGILRGVVAAQIASWLSFFVLLAILQFTPDRALLRKDLEAAAGRMIFIFLPYAVLVLSNLVLRLVPSIDLRSATSVFFLGPLTALRPFLMIAGVTFGICQAQSRATVFLGLFVLLLMLSMEFALNLYNARLQDRQIRALI